MDGEDKLIRARVRATPYRPDPIKKYTFSNQFDFRGRAMMQGILRAGILSLCLVTIPSCRQEGTQTSAESDVARSSSGSKLKISKDLAKINNAFLELKATNDIPRDTDAVYRFLKQADGMLKGSDATNDPSAVLVASQLRLLLPFRGIVYRLAHLADDDKMGLKNAIVTTIMTIATGNRLLATDVAGAGRVGGYKALGRYLAYPYALEAGQHAYWHKDVPGQVIAKFSDLAEFQQFLLDLVEEVEFSRTKVRAIKLSKKPIVFDNQALFGHGSFGSGDAKAEDRYTRVWQPGVDIVAGGLSMLIHNILYFNAYNYDTLPAFSKELAKSIGLGVFTNPQGLPAKDRAAILTCTKGKLGTIRDMVGLNKDCKFRDLFSLKDGGRAFLKRALPEAKDAARKLDAAWKGIKKRGEKLSDAQKRFDLLNPARILPWRNITGRAIEDTVAVIIGSGESGVQGFRDAVTGKVIRVRFDHLYKAPPRNLQDFRPLSFQSGSARMHLKLTGGKTVEVQNFEYGMSTEWNSEIYTRYFVIEGESQVDPRQLTRFFAQSWGGTFANVPFLTVAMVF